MFDGLNDGELATAITGESGTNTLTRQGLEEYVPTCVLALDHRIVNEVCTRRVRVVKSRGSAHGTNEYPFLMDEQGISILPIRALGHEPQVSDERLGTGIPWLDAMLSGTEAPAFYLLMQARDAAARPGS